MSLAEKPDLWNQFGAPTERRLLFIAEDFKDPDQSDVFRELENLSANVKHLASKLKEFCKQSVDQLEPLETVLPKTSPAQVAYNQGIAYLHSNRYSEAIVEFKKVIGLDPNYKEVHHGLGLAHLKMNNPGEAKRAAEAALGIDPHYRPARQLLDAVKSFKPPPVPPPPPSPGGSGQASTKRWQYTSGALAFTLLICIVALAMQMDTNQTLSNENTRLLRENQKLRNQLTERDKEIKDQIVIAEQLRHEKEELRSQNQKLQNENAALQKQLKERGPPPNGDQFHAAPLQKIYHNSVPRVRSTALSKNNQGYTAFDRGQHSKAIALFQDAKESDLTSSVVRYNLGSTYLVMREYIKARDYLQEAVILNSDFKEAHYNLALTQLRRGNRQEAKKAAQAALKIDGNYQFARQLLAAIE